MGSDAGDEMKRLWHELPKKERNEVLKTGYTNKEFLRRFAQPEWCNYPHQEALHLGGCFNLVTGKIKNRGDCKQCYRKDVRE